MIPCPCAVSCENETFSRLSRNGKGITKNESVVDLQEIIIRYGIKDAGL